MKERFILCPICKQKTRATIRDNTEAKQLPVFCPKCKNTSIVDVKNGNVELSNK